MRPLHLIRTGLILAAVGPHLVPHPARADEPAAAAAPAPAAREAVSPEMFQLLDPATLNPLLAAKNYLEVRRRIGQAEALPGKSAYEDFVLNRLRVALAVASGDQTAAERGDFMLALAKLHYNAKEYPQAIAWFTQYQQETGGADKARPYLIRSYYLNNEFDRAKQELLADLQADQKAGRQAAKEDLLLLASASARSGDAASYLLGIENLVRHYPSDVYWNELLGRVGDDQPAHAQRTRLDALRLGYAYALAGQPEQAIMTLRTVGDDGAAGALARYWMLWLQLPATPTPAAPTAPK